MNRKLFLAFALFIVPFTPLFFGVSLASASGAPTCSVAGATSVGSGYTLSCTNVTVPEVDVFTTPYRVEYYNNSPSGPTYTSLPSNFTVICPPGGGTSGIFTCGGADSNICDGTYCTTGTVGLYDSTYNPLTCYVTGCGGATTASLSGSPLETTFANTQVSLLTEFGWGVGLVVALLLIALGVRMLIKWSKKGVSAG